MSTNNPIHQKPIQIIVNGVMQQRLVEPRTSLVDFLREDLGLTGTHVGCEHGVCGACTVAHNPHPTEDQVRDAISSNICRCTGYQQIVDAVMYATQAENA